MEVTVEESWPPVCAVVWPGLQTADVNVVQSFEWTRSCTFSRLHCGTEAWGLAFALRTA